MRDLGKHIVRLFLLLVSQFCWAQTDNQFWFEGMLNYPFANVYNLESALTYSYAPNFQPRWVSIDLQETLERSLSQNFDVMASGLISSTLQNDSLSTRELRAMVGTRIHFTPNSRILTRVMVRFENRNMLNTETDVWSSSNRTRIRAETIVPFNKPTMFSGDQLWYGIFDAEIFYVMDQNLHERFANRFRLRAGLGYRLNYRWRYELMYTLQESRNEVSSGFDTIDNIFRVRVKFFLNPSKPSKVVGTGN